jgi:hypothetical protein
MLFPLMHGLSAPLSALLLAALAFTTTGRALAGEDVAFESLPAPVQQTIAREVGSGQVKEIERDWERGRVVYEVEYLQGDVEWEIDVGEDGALLERKH